MDQPQYDHEAANMLAVSLMRNVLALQEALAAANQHVAELEGQLAGNGQVTPMKKEPTG